jgi:hypothetical protein
MPRKLLLFCLCSAIGCTGAAITPPPQRQPAVEQKGQSPAGVVEAQRDQERCRAKVGQEVHFRFGYTVVPTMMISRLDVSVNGEPVAHPELFAPQTNPGYGELIYVFRPKKSGEYRVMVTPVTAIGPGAASSWLVEVAD